MSGTLSLEADNRCRPIIGPGDILLSDDCGYSGGTMRRPALQRLLQDIKALRVDTVVVYEVDRLTRSLADFAKIIETFDAHKVSFVSVTQQFNTTSSMGRLTLNVLLSFAQFEREVTGERIRDKIAASKRKGMWMGGTIPLGYDLKDRKLVVNPKEAKLVRRFFESGEFEEKIAPIYGVKIPPGYRDWRLISVARVGDPLNDLRAKLGNDIAVKAYREGKLPFPDGTIIARLAWKQKTSETIKNAFRVRGGTETNLSPEQVEKLVDGSFVAGSPTNVQFMVKDSKKYASTGGWGFAQFNGGKPADEATHKTCFSCHEPAKDSDFVFTRYAP